MKDRFTELLDKMRDIRAAKSHDYGEIGDPYANCRRCEELGIPAWKGVLIRIGDKYSRLVSFAKQGELKVKDESVEDTFLDLANYALIGLVLYEEWREKQIREAAHQAANPPSSNFLETWLKENLGPGVKVVRCSPSKMEGFTGLTPDMDGQADIGTTDKEKLRAILCTDLEKIECRKIDVINYYTQLANDIVTRLQKLDCETHSTLGDRGQGCCNRGPDVGRDEVAPSQ